MKAENIKNVACIGGGVIGSSWASLFAVKGLTVKVYDLNEELINKAKDNVKRTLDSLVELGAITADASVNAAERVTFTTSMEEAAKGIQLVQENGPEKLEIKQSILENVEKYIHQDVIYVTSTSGLVVSDIAANAKHPERCIGGHPYNPPHLIPLVEIALGDKTSEEVVKTTIAFYETIGKEPVVLKKACPGFISNRLQMAIFREMMELVIRGVCTVEEVEKALVFGPGIRWGILGMHMILQLGDPNGFESMMNKLASAGEYWMTDMADWKVYPREYFPMAQTEVDKMMDKYPDDIGHDNETVSKYRDKMLVELLKLHKKF